MYLVEYRNNEVNRIARKDMTAEEFFLWSDSLAYGSELVRLWWYTKGRMEMVKFLDKGTYRRDPERMEIRDYTGHLLDVGYGE